MIILKVSYKLPDKAERLIMSNKDMSAEVLKQLKKREEANKEAEAERVEAVAKVLGLGMLAIGLAFVSAVAVKSFNNWSKENQIMFQFPVKVLFNEPIRIEKVEQVINLEPVIIKEKISTGNLNEELICNVFGVSNCKMAIAIMKAESGGNPEAFNINDNNSIDVGLFQINSIHYKSAGCSLREVINPEQNISCAYSIYKKSGWSAWSSYNSGAYQKFLK